MFFLRTTSYDWQTFYDQVVSEIPCVAARMSSFCAACRLALQKTPQGQPFPAPAELINCPRAPKRFSRLFVLACPSCLRSVATVAFSLSPASARIFRASKTSTSSCWYRPKHSLSLAIINYLCRGCLIEKAEREKDKQVNKHNETFRIVSDNPATYLPAQTALPALPLA